MKTLFDFKNKDYNVREAIKKIRTNPKCALWFIDKLSDYDIAKVFVKEWDRAMSEKFKEN